MGVGAVLGSTTAPTASRSGSARGWGGQPSASGRPRYVLSIEPVTATVVVGERELPATERITAQGPTWCAPVPPRERVFVQIRGMARRPPASSTVPTAKVFR